MELLELDVELLELLLSKLDVELEVELSKLLDVEEEEEYSLEEVLVELELEDELENVSSVVVVASVVVASVVVSSVVVVGFSSYPPVIQATEVIPSASLTHVPVHSQPI